MLHDSSPAVEEEIAKLRAEAGALVGLARELVKTTGAALPRAVDAPPAPPASSAPAPAGPVDLTGLSAGAIADAIMRLPGRRASWVRTRLMQRLEARAGGVRAAGGGKDRVVRPGRAGNRRAVVINLDRPVD